MVPGFDNPYVLTAAVIVATLLWLGPKLKNPVDIVVKPIVHVLTLGKK